MQNCSAMPTRGGLQVHYARHLEQHRRRWCSLQAVQEDQIRNTALELTAANERTEHVLREVTLYPFLSLFLLQLSYGWDGEYNSSTMPLYTLTITHAHPHYLLYLLL